MTGTAKNAALYRETVLKCLDEPNTLMMWTLTDNMPVSKRVRERKAAPERNNSGSHSVRAVLLRMCAEKNLWQICGRSKSL